MLERVPGAPAGTLALRASGTVIASDVGAALDATLGAANAAMGLAVIIDPDFDGYLVELARGLTNASLAHKQLVRIAVIADADQMEGATLAGFDVSAVPIRLFTTSDEKAAFDWTSAARRNGVA
jgi:hypothetical protein